MLAWKFPKQRRNQVKVANGALSLDHILTEFYVKDTTQ